MNTRKIIALSNRAKKEAEKAVEAIYKKYSPEMNRLIASEIPIGHSLWMGNGMCVVYDSEDNRLEFGKAWGRFSNERDSEQLEKISTLQYADDIQGYFDLETELKGTKSVGAKNQTINP